MFVYCHTGQTAKTVRADGFDTNLARFLRAPGVFFRYTV